MTYATTMTQKGQITVPAAIRHHFGLKPSDKLLMSVEDEKITVKPMKKSFLDLYGSVKHKGKKPLDFKKLRKQFIKEMAENVITEMNK